MNTWELRRRWLCRYGLHSWREVRQEKLGRTIAYCRRTCGVRNRIVVWDPELYAAWNLPKGD